MGLIINPANDIIKMSSLNKGLVGHWPLDKESQQSATIFADKTPHENKGTSVNAPVFTADRMGQADRAMSFDGESDYVRIPDSESLSPTSEMTAMFWVKGAGQSGKGILTHYDSGTNQRGWQFLSGVVSPHQKIRLLMSDDGTWNPGHRKYYTSSITVFDDTWHLVGFTFDTGNLKIFIDGIEDINVDKGGDDPITTVHDSTADIMIGCYLNNDIPTGFFDGDISGAKIWNRALSSTEITMLYDMYRPKIVLDCH